MGQDAIICFSDFAHLQEDSPRPVPQRGDASDGMSTDDDLPDPDQGWSPERSKLLARDCLASLAEWLEPET